VITGRFAPSPTGDLHLGNLRTALAAWMSAHRDGPRTGRFLVRFEDLDRVTSSRDIAARQLADLAAIGIEPDEPPVFQSDRFDLYDAAIDGLIARGLTYPCFCTRREIREAAEAPHGGQTAYPGTCRTLTPRERARRALERPGAVRLNAEAAGFSGAEIGFRDALAGDVVGPVDDVVLRRNDGVPAYNVAVVWDSPRPSTRTCLWWWAATESDSPSATARSHSTICRLWASLRLTCCAIWPSVSESMRRTPRRRPI